jgi:hypothetical protein
MGRCNRLALTRSTFDIDAVSVLSLVVMSEQKCECPLCGKVAQAVELRGPTLVRRIECTTCTTYEISERLEHILTDEADAKGRARFLSDAARSATHGTGPNILKCCLKLNEENYVGIALVEEGFQQHVKPVGDYLAGEGIEVLAKHRFVHLELLIPGNERPATLKVEDSLFTNWTSAELMGHCRDYDIAGKLAKTPSSQPVEITKCDAKPRSQG